MKANIHKIIFRIFILAAVAIATACCKDDTLKGQDPAVVWVNRICGNSMIADIGLGYPIYKNTVVFHSTPFGDKFPQDSYLHGLDTETGKEKWRLTRSDFAPIKDFKFLTLQYCYQHENIVVGNDLVRKDSPQSYCYGINIETGKVLWVKQLPRGYNDIGDIVRGSGEIAYINAMNFEKFDLLKINIQTGEMNVVNHCCPVKSQNYICPL